jgi:transposase
MKMRKSIEKVFKPGKDRAVRKSTEPYDSKLKSKLIKEYLKGDKSFAMLSKQYGINAGIISRWVRIVRYGREPKAAVKKISKFTGMKKKLTRSAEELQEENLQLRKQLEEEKLKGLVYEKVIEIAKRDYDIDLLKKYEARRSSK